MLSRFLGTGAGHVTLGLRNPPDIANADTTPEPPPISNETVTPGQDFEVDSGEEYDSDENSGVTSDGGDSEDGVDEVDGFFADAPLGDDAWEDVEPEDEDPLFDYDYSN